jgi:hypothetical protein
VHGIHSVHVWNARKQNHRLFDRASIGSLCLALYLHVSYLRGRLCRFVFEVGICLTFAVLLLALMNSLSGYLGKKMTVTTIPSH